MAIKRIALTFGLMSCYLVSNAQEISVSEDEMAGAAEGINCLKGEAGHQVELEVRDDCYLKIAGQEVNFPGVVVRAATSVTSSVSKTAVAAEAGKAFVSGVGAGIGAWSADRLSSSLNSKSGCSGNKQGCEIHPESFETPDEHFDN